MKETSIFTSNFFVLFFEIFIFIWFAVFDCSIDDPLKKNATIGFINNFGQIPKQLFKKAHPCKKMGGNNNNRTSVIDTGALVQAFTLPQPEKLFFHHLDNLRPSLQPIKGKGIFFFCGVEATETS